jgi:hypothetical protein
MLASLLMVSGCMVHQSDRNAPGIADVAVAPAANAARQIERPVDQGDHEVLLTYGGFASIGTALGGSNSGQFVYALGPELNIARGITLHSERKEFFWPWMRTAYGVNIGWTAITRTDKQVAGPLYLEAEYRETLGSAALGWAVSPRTGGQGPQATFKAGPLYVRANHEFAGPTQLTIGLFLQGYNVWFWSR